MQYFRSTFALTACRMTGLLCDKLFAKKEKKDDKFYIFEVERFQTPVILLQESMIPILLAMLKNTWKVIIYM